MRHCLCRTAISIVLELRKTKSLTNAVSRSAALFPLGLTGTARCQIADDVMALSASTRLEIAKVRLGSANPCSANPLSPADRKSTMLATWS